jgi:hypothetical protein
MPDEKFHAQLDMEFLSGISKMHETYSLVMSDHAVKMHKLHSKS